MEGLVRRSSSSLLAVMRVRVSWIVQFPLRYSRLVVVVVVVVMRVVGVVMYGGWWWRVEGKGGDGDGGLDMV